MGDARALDHADRAFELRGRAAQVGEQGSAAAEHHRYEPDADLVTEAGFEALPDDLVPLTTTFLSPAISFAVATAALMPSVTNTRFSSVAGRSCGGRWDKHDRRDIHGVSAAPRASHVVEVPADDQGAGVPRRAGRERPPRSPPGARGPGSGTSSWPP